MQIVSDTTSVMDSVRNEGSEVDTPSKLPVGGAISAEKKVIINNLKKKMQKVKEASKKAKVYMEE